MSERRYFVICEDNCKFESLTKEQIYDAIAEATGSTPTPVDEAFITQIKEQNANHSLKMWKGTEAQYNALEEKDTDTVYIITRSGVAPRIVNSTVLEEEIDQIATEVRPIAKGGTGATDGETALSNLGLADMFQYFSFTSEARTIAANSSTTFNLDVEKAGYKPIGILSYNINLSGAITVNFIKMASNHIEANLHNYSNESQSNIKFNIVLMYVKN